MLRPGKENGVREIDTKVHRAEVWECLVIGGDGSNILPGNGCPGPTRIAVGGESVCTVYRGLERRELN